MEVKKTDLTDAEIDKKLQDKLDVLLNVIDVDITAGETIQDDITDVVPESERSEDSLTSDTLDTPEQPQAPSPGHR
jgi:hypothetical protein